MSRTRILRSLSFWKRLAGRRASSRPDEIRLALGDGVSHRSQLGNQSTAASR